MAELHSSEEICEALVRHVEVSGSECFEKNFVLKDRVACTVWCVIGENAEGFRDMAIRWLSDQGFHRDGNEP